MKPKSLIFISIDALRADCVSANPNKILLGKFNLKKKIKTPNIDRFARSGIFFSQCITAAPYTTTAHASILTGCWPYNHGIIDFFSNAKLARPTIFEILKKSGYTVIWQTDYPFLLGQNLGFAKGVDYFIEGDERKSFGAIKKNIKKPIACFFHFADAHAPYGFVDAKKGGQDYREKLAKLIKKYKIKADTESNDEAHFITGDLTKLDKIMKQNYFKVLEQMYSLGLYGEIMDLYIEGINRFDSGRFKNFINNLKKLKILDSAIVVIAGDHGEDWDKSNQGHNRGGLTDGLTDGNIIVPLIISGAGIPAGKLITKQARTVDIAPTIMNLLLIKNQKIFDGVDLLSLKNQNKIQPAFSQIWQTGTDQTTKYMQAVKNKKNKKPFLASNLAVSSARFENIKLVKNHDCAGNKKARWFILPQEKKLIGKTGNTVLTIEKMLDKYDKKTKQSFKKTSRQCAIADELRTLGYKI